VDGSEPTGASSLYSEPLVISATTTLSARAFHPDYPDSGVASGAYVIDDYLVPPTLDPSGGSYRLALDVQVSCANTGVVVHYRTDGEAATVDDPAVVCGGSIHVDHTASISVISARGASTSDVGWTNFRISGDVSVGAHRRLLLRPDGTVWEWPEDADLAAVGLSDVIAIAAGGTHNLALKADGTVWAWGENDEGQLGNGTNDASATPVQVNVVTGVTAIAAGAQHSMALGTEDGVPRVWAWGAGANGELGDGASTASSLPVPVSGIANPVAIACGEHHSMALTQDGVVWVWGNGEAGQIGDGSTSSSAVPVAVTLASAATRIAAGDTQSLTILDDATLRGWGLGWGPSPVVAHTCDYSDGEGEGGDGGFCSPLDLTSVQDADAGASHVLVRQTDRFTSWAPPIANDFAPLDAFVDPSDPVVHFSTAGNFNLAATETGTVWSWMQGEAPSLVANISGPPLPLPPVLSPPPGRYYSEQTVTVAMPSGDATMYYTTDGREPTEASAVLTSGSNLAIDRNTSLRILSSQDGRTARLSDATYLLQVMTPTIDAVSSTADQPFSVVVHVTTPDAVVHYSFTGIPSEDDPSVPSDGSISVTPPAQLFLLGTRTAWTPSELATAIYTYGVSAPRLQPPGGRYTGPITVMLTSATAGSTIWYSIDGGLEQAIPSGSTIVVDRSQVVTALARREGLPDSALTTESYRFGLPAPTLLAERVGGDESSLYLRGATVVTGGVVRCTFDGSDPNVTSADCRRARAVDQSVVVRARTFKLGWDPSPIAEQPFSVAAPAVTAPMIALESGTYPSTRQVRVSVETPGAVIHYTTNGATPTTSDPVIASGDTVAVDRSLVLKARAWAGSDVSVTAGADYLISGAITVGNKTALALKTDGTIWGFGVNNFGQLGGVPSNGSLTPQQADIDSVVALATGTAHSVAVRADGSVWSWGANDAGQLGIGDMTVSASTSPVAIAVNDAIDVAVSGVSAALDATGHVWVWGQVYPWMTPEDRAVRSAPFRVDGQQCARLYGGNGLICVDVAGAAWWWDDSTRTFVPDPFADGLLGQVQDALLLAEGDIIGATASGGVRRPNVPSSLLLSDDVLTGQDGVAYRDWNQPDRRQASLEAELTVAVARSAMVGADGALWRWGSNDWGQVGDGTTIDRPDATRVAGLSLFGGTWLLEDADGDGLTNLLELYYRTDPYDRDTNGDGVSDGGSVAMGRDPVSVDLDGDGVSNAVELKNGTDPLRPDTDGDGVPDGTDTFPLDPTRSTPGTPAPDDHTPPDITLTSPAGAVLISSVP
jgi:alpha-tubulin suppressor-like RCC1 family protein